MSRTCRIEILEFFPFRVRGNFDRALFRDEGDLEEGVFVGGAVEDAADALADRHVVGAPTGIHVDAEIAELRAAIRECYQDEPAVLMENFLDTATDNDAAFEGDRRLLAFVDAYVAQLVTPSMFPARR